MAAERSEEERSGAKWRGRGLGQRNTKYLKVDINFILFLTISMKRRQSLKIDTIVNICFIGSVALFFAAFGYRNYKNNQMKNIILLGKPGCGKGTQAKVWVEKYNLYHIDAGQLLRNCVKENCKYKETIESAFKGGALVTNEILSYVLTKELNDNVYCLTCKYKGAIFDGSPRNMENVKIFQENDFKIKAVIDLYVDDAVSKKRVMNRKSGRSDDNAEIVAKRLKSFNKDTLPVFEYFKSKGLYQKIDANGTYEEVLENSMKVLDKIYN